MTEKWPAGKRYRDLFESVKKSVLDAVSAEKHIPRTAVPAIKEHIQTSFKSLQVETAADPFRDDLEQMISDMTGGAVGFWDDADINMNLELNHETGFSGQSTEGDLQGSEWEPTDSSIWFDNNYVDQDFK